MKKKFLLSAVIVLLLTGFFIFSNQRVTAQELEPTPAVPLETMGENSRSVDDISPNALVGFIQTNNPYCYQPDTTRDQCVINVRYMQATDDGTNSPFLYTLEVKLNNKLRYQSNTFFESVIYYSYDMIPNGLTVSCGAPNEDGQGIDYGKLYNMEIRARAFDGTSMGANYTAVRCPAYNTP